MSTESRRILSILELVKHQPATAGCGKPASHGLEALDDCAVVPISATEDLIIGTDFVRGSGFHLFRRGVLSWHDVGYYLVGANASDLAAMGAAPLGFVLVLRYSPEMTDEEFSSAAAGAVQACSDFCLPLLGGDTGGYDVPVLSGTAFGICPHGRALLRSQGADGDILFLTGEVGLAAAALSYYTRGVAEGMALPTDQEEELAQSWRRVRPHLRQGEILVKNRLSRCAIDTSDGLKAACRQLAEASGLSAILRRESIPVATLASTVAAGLGVDQLAFAIGDSVDFRLVFSSPPNVISKLKEIFTNEGLALFEIGRLENRSDVQPGAYFEADDKTLVPLPGIEWAQSETMTIDQLRQKGGSHL